MTYTEELKAISAKDQLPEPELIVWVCMDNMQQWYEGHVDGFSGRLIFTTEGRRFDCKLISHWRYKDE